MDDKTEDQIISQAAMEAAQVILSAPGPLRAPAIASHITIMAMTTHFEVMRRLDALVIRISDLETQVHELAGGKKSKRKPKTDG